MTLNGKRVSGTTVSVASLAVVLAMQTVAFSFYMGVQNQKLNDVERDVSRLVAMHLTKGESASNEPEKSFGTNGGNRSTVVTGGVNDGARNGKYSFGVVETGLYVRPAKRNFARSGQHKRFVSFADGGNSRNLDARTSGAQIAVVYRGGCSAVLEGLLAPFRCDVVTETNGRMQ